MVANKIINDSDRTADHMSTETEPQLNEKDQTSKIMKFAVIGISLAVLIILITFFIAFLYGWYGLYALGIISLVAIPFVLIGGAIYTIIKRKWVLLSLGFILLPASWILTLIGCMSDPPFDPADISMHMIHAAVLVSGAFACWVFLTLIFWPRRA